MNFTDLFKLIIVSYRQVFGFLNYFRYSKLYIYYKTILNYNIYIYEEDDYHENEKRINKRKFR